MDRQGAKPLLVRDYEDLARARLPADVWDFISGGSGTESTLTANRAALERIRLRPRVLTDVTACDPGTELLGARIAAPIGIAPMAYHRLACPEGETATARAAGLAGVPLIVSMFASRTLAEIAAAGSGPLWLQLYWLRQRELLTGLVRRAEEAGFGALVLTVDAPRVGRRLRDVRNGFVLPPGVHAANVAPEAMAASHRAAPDASAIERHAREQFDSSITWKDLAQLRALTTLPLVLKGILTAEDARLALDHGVDAVIVSNHGGRQLDGAVASAQALPEIAAAVGGRCRVIVDGGIRHGTDVLKVLALGADAALVGRPVLWGLAQGGAQGVSDVLGLLRDELEEAMALSGRPRIADVDRSAVVL
ncbi:alpha-hydroxy acid oxidase [Kitasatospora cineracea]|uniref:4-hydroxymandelate oxidase n=1 Tax=Kitasatospora cineracea TaxID=88074 RepID=A0A3N4RWS1_9ACTN|nr:alpha-hydroxy acid oxidase [Kitasatospora cineracea]RPE28514.1 4-hydroxymandelate oxidase [Kitasatospora cineracea]